jgi:hypothetical protein
LNWLSAARGRTAPLKGDACDTARGGGRVPLGRQGASARRLLLGLTVVTGLVLPARAGAELIPVPTPTVSGVLGNNGWHTSNVTIRWTISEPDKVINTSGCDTRTLTTDTTGTNVTCSVEGVDGAVSVTVRVKIDKTPPAVGAPNANRPMEASGWYTGPVVFAFSGNDATSGIESCTSVQYSGPDNESAAIAGTCRDFAGNVGGPLTVAFKYDATAPAFARARVAPGDRSALLRWQPASDSAVVEITRLGGAPGAGATVVYRGRSTSYADRGLRLGAAYRYILTSFDRAGNRASVALGLRVRSLYAPQDGARVASPPLLAWVRVPRARYYNVQVFRRGRKILSAWPSRPSLQLAERWSYGGRRVTLAPGRYRWQVWPGFGSRTKGRYGRLLGKSEFVVRASGR